ncbi:MAG: hypothetical protein QNJ55_26545 [Xenococcus sp. MO_188.B8]|nr:hypothetical protein [Xenococcus sp. MO_188.B8]
MRTIQTQVQINGDRILSVPLLKNIAEETYQVVIVMNLAIFKVEYVDKIM